MLNFRGSVYYLFPLLTASSITTLLICSDGWSQPSLANPQEHLHYPQRSANSQEVTNQQVVGQLPTLPPASYPPGGYTAPAIAPPNSAYPSYPGYPGYPYPVALPGYPPLPYPGYPATPSPMPVSSGYPGYPSYPVAVPPPGYVPYPAYPAAPYPYPYPVAQPALPTAPPQSVPPGSVPQPNTNVGAMPPAPSYYPQGYPAYPYPYPYPVYPYPYLSQPGVPAIAPQPAPPVAAPLPTYNWAAPPQPVAPPPGGQPPTLPPSNFSAPGVQPVAPGNPPPPAVVPAPYPSQPSLPTETVVQSPAQPARSLLGNSTALSDPTYQVQGVYIYQGDESSARGRFSATYPLTPRILFGTTLDLTTGSGFTDSRDEGLSLNELYVATSPAELPNLRFVVGQLDLTSYFDRNSFAKDGASHFFNPVFQTNPALTASSIGSRPGALVNWALSDNLEAKAAVFSSSRSISDFALDGFAGEVGLRYGNAIIRGTYASGRDAGSRDGFREIFQVSRDGGLTSGPSSDDREEAFGVNAEVFIPSLNMGLFGRYGQYNNRDLDRQGDTFNVGLTFLDLFAPDDRLGLAYGRQLSNANLRRELGDRNPDVLELYYDFRFLPNLRIGFTVQELNNFSEIIAGFRLKTEFDVSPRGREADARGREAR